MSIEQNFDIPFVANLAQREKQVQQNYRPVIAVHKWFARRPGTLFRSLLLAEFAGKPLRECFFESNDLPGVRMADPFMGGGTPILEANRLGCDVWGCDINPMAQWIVEREVADLEVEAYRRTASVIRGDLARSMGGLYRTRCVKCDHPSADVKYFLWVKTQRCSGCGKDVDLMPGYVLAKNVRHPAYVLVCPGCGELNETRSLTELGRCRNCHSALELDGPARRSSCACSACGESVAYPDPRQGHPQHRLFAIEYVCDHCKPTHNGRFFKKPDGEDLARYREASARVRKATLDCVPEEEIEKGDESSRLLRWGYKQYRDLFNDRQLLGLNTLVQMIDALPKDEIRNALATNLSDLLRYQNMLCRYDAMALKSLDVFSVHGFPVGLIQCESNLLGIYGARGKPVGSGGWCNIVEKYATAKEYCRTPFETDERTGRKKIVFTSGEMIGPHGVNGRGPRAIHLVAGDSAIEEIPDASLDIVLTDPPYFANVQYAELMDFCYVWLRRFLPGKKAFRRVTTRHAAELTGNDAMGRDIAHFSEGLSAVFQRMKRALKPGQPLAFTYHHNDLAAYYPVAAGLLDAGLVCSASLPCPAEMGGSIHISGTASSIIDTVFVCRSTGTVPRSMIVENAAGIAALVTKDVDQLEVGDIKPTQGDIRCIAYGQLIRMAIWRLRSAWDRDASPTRKLDLVAQDIERFASLDEVWTAISGIMDRAPRTQLMAAMEARGEYGLEREEIPF